MRKALPAVLVLLLVLAFLNCAGATTYVPRELPGVNNSTQPVGIANTGDVAGTSYVRGTTGEGRPHLMFWGADGACRDMGEGYMYDINNYGDVLCYSREYGQAIVRKDGSRVELSATFGYWSGYCLNDAGQVAGMTYAPPNNGHLFTWSAATGKVDLGTLREDLYNLPLDLNNLGQIVGQSSDSSEYLPITYSPATGIRQLPLLPGHDRGIALSVNDLGQAVGQSWSSVLRDYHAVLWNSDGSVVDLGKGYASGINAKGQIALLLDGYRYVRDPDGTLSRLNPLPGMKWPFAEAINDSGVVVGFCVDAEDCNHAVIWEPVKPVTVGLTIDPPVLNPKAKGKWVTAYIELPADAQQTLRDIDLTSVKLQDSVALAETPTSIGDHDGDGIPDLMLKFDSAVLCRALVTGTQTVKLTGEFVDGTAIEGECTVRVLGK